MIDLRSDTVTRPTAPMIEAMMHAKVGDDVFGEDPTVKELEEYAAHLLGADDAIYCPSGTMTNQIGVHVLSSPYEEVICYSHAHIYKYEGGGVAGTSGLSFRLIDGDRGRLSPDDIHANINPDDVHYPRTTLVALENTVNKGGGCFYTLEQIQAIATAAQQHNLKMHLDGARLFNALVETGDSPSEYGKYFDTISICLSKGLGAPVGSLLVGKAEYIKKARRVRKFLGGGMRQAGYIAAAGLYALRNHTDRLKDDHSKAKKLGKALAGSGLASEVYPVETNIVIFKTPAHSTPQTVLEKLQEHNVLGVPFGAAEVRLVTHLDVSDEEIEKACNIITTL